MRPLRQKCFGGVGQVRELCSKPVSDRSGFSLIEMLIVLALLLVMMSMYYGFGSESHQRRQQRLCAGNLQKINIALQIFANDHDGNLPSKPDAKTSEEPLDELVPQYTSDTEIFICPGSKDSAIPQGQSFGNHRISYAYYMGRRLTDGATTALMSDRQVDANSKAVGQVAFSTTGKPPGNNHSKYGGNILFCDGHTEVTPPKTVFSLVYTQGVVLLNPKP